MVWPHPYCSLVGANPRMNPSFILKTRKGNSPNHYKGECRVDIKGRMLKVVLSPFLISWVTDTHGQSLLELLHFLGRKRESIALINYSVISISLETQFVNNFIWTALLASLWSISVCWHKKVSEFQSWCGLSHVHPGEPWSLLLLYTMFWLLFCKDINEFPRSKPALSQHSLTYINKICCSNCEIICIHNYSVFSHKLQSYPRKHIKIEIHYLRFIVQNGFLFYQAAMI